MMGRRRLEQRAWPRLFFFLVAAVSDGVAVHVSYLAQVLDD